MRSEALHHEHNSETGGPRGPGVRRQSQQVCGAVMVCRATDTHWGRHDRQHPLSTRSLQEGNNDKVTSSIQRTQIPPSL